ncbi:MAG: hypothetical protein DU430_05150 [Candidatus Tokpelaia sp.]|nr:MAG: hypothetical protein DU430_05150 [Candidatus Tokpelaia sp.]
MQPERHYYISFLQFSQKNNKEQARFGAKMPVAENELKRLHKHAKAADIGACPVSKYPNGGVELRFILHLPGEAQRLIPGEEKIAERKSRSLIF